MNYGKSVKDSDSVSGETLQVFLLFTFLSVSHGKTGQPPEALNTRYIVHGILNILHYSILLNIIA